MFKMSERRGGGEVIWAMPERKHSFLHEVFPNGPSWGLIEHLGCQSLKERFFRDTLYYSIRLLALMGGEQAWTLFFLFRKTTLKNI